MSHDKISTMALQNKNKYDKSNVEIKIKLYSV